MTLKPFAQLAAQECLRVVDPDDKVALTAASAAAFMNGELDVDDANGEVEPIGNPGRPSLPRLVHPRHVAQRGLGSLEGRAAFIHAIAHIEFNAINLAWDAVYRFRGMPRDYYADWVGVAADEARHFSLLRARLRELGHDYGDFDAHDGLWEMAMKTAGSCRERMALVPRVLEARGLDVTPGMIVRLREVGDEITAGILEIILREEVAHVAAGSRWFRWCCERDGVEPEAEFRRLLALHARGAVRGPLNFAARVAAGFSATELDAMTVVTSTASSHPSAGSGPA
ncbi:MAG: ferritin-like domain-containing protein [Proteobacteria bacterium]|nr:ferritin-like domain-containing protein [Pseudomonadota bacterium]